MSYKNTTMGDRAVENTHTKTARPREAQGLGSLATPLNTRIGELPRPKEKKALKQAIARLKDALTTRNAALAIGAILWGLAQKEAHYAATSSAIKWARSAASRLGVALTESKAEEIAALLGPIVEEGLLHRVGHFIDILVPHLYPGGKRSQSEARKQNGTYITPYPIARLMVERALQAAEEWPPLSLLDPGTGTGVFLSAALHVLSHRGLAPDEALKRLCGVEREGALAELARLLLSLEAGLDPEEVLRGLGPQIFVGDFLLKGPPMESREKASAHGPYSVIVMNPPYERISKIDRAGEATKLEAREYAGRIRQSGLYPLAGREALDAHRLFVERALGLLAPGGGASFIIPATFLTDAAAKELRRHLLDRGWIVSVDLYPERTRLFEGVSQEVVILTLASSRRGGGDHQIQVLYRGNHIDALPLKEVRVISKDFPLPMLNRRGLALYRHLARYPRLGDLPGVVIQRGELDQTKDRKLLGHGNGRLLRGKHLRRFALLGEDRCDLEALSVRKRGSAKVKHVFQPRLAGRQVANRHARERLAFAYVMPPTVLGNSLNYILFDTDTTLSSPFDLWVILGLLNSNILNWFFHVNNSNNHVALYELESLPLPAEANPQVVDRIRTIAITATNEGPKPELQEELDRLVLEAFGLDKRDLEGVFPSIEIG